MKKLIFLSFLQILLFYKITNSQKVEKIKMLYYPPYAEVINKFLNDYSPGNIENQTMFDLVKKPDGWHARNINYADYKPVRDELFWSAKERKYLGLSFPLNSSGKIDPENEYLKANYDAILFSVFVPYWGYQGWDKDVINDFGDKNNLSDTLQNALARAYSSYAGSFLRPQVYYTTNADTVPKGQNALSPDILSKYLKYEHLAIENFYKLNQMSPGFETFVSNSFNVYSNEILNCFLTLRYYQNEETAKKELKSGLYDSFYIEMAKNYLNSCDSNAILFTNGDMDTYPLLYVQENENFRKDVLIVNASLLDLGRYANHMANFKGGAKPVKLTMDSSIYKSEIKPYFYVIEKSDQFLAADKLFSLVASDDKSTKFKTTDNQLIDYLPSRDIYFKIDNKKYRNQYKNELNSTDTSINIHINKNYLTISEFCMLDIISTNLFERPIYFAITVASDNYLGLEDYFRLEALAYKLTPTKRGNVYEHTTGHIKSDVLYNGCFEKLRFQKQNYNSIVLSKDQKHMVNNYRNILARLANQFLVDNKPKMTLYVLDNCIDLFPSDIIPYDNSALTMIDNYFNIGQKEKAIKIATTYYNQLESELKTNSRKSKNEDVEFELKRNTYELNNLYNMIIRYISNEEITKKIKITLDKYINNLN